MPSLWLCEHSCSYCNLLARKRPCHTCRGWWFEVAVRAAGLCQKDQIWAGHQWTHIKELRHFKSSALTFMASVYARSCTLTYTFLLCRVEGTHVSDGNVSYLVPSSQCLNHCMICHCSKDVSRCLSPCSTNKDLSLHQRLQFEVKSTSVSQKNIRDWTCTLIRAS